VSYGVWLTSPIGPYMPSNPASMGFVVVPKLEMLRISWKNLQIR